jgi:hypothetical protein
MTFDLQTILVQDQTFHHCNHAQEVMQLLALEYVQLTLYDPKGKSKRCHIDLNKLRVKLETVKDSTLVRLPPSEDTFKQHVLRSSYPTKIWLIAHIPKPAVASPLEHGCNDGKFGLEPILFEGQMSSDFWRKSHQSRIFDSFQFYPQFVQIDMASFRLSLRIIQP